MTELFALNIHIITQRWPELAAKIRAQSFEHFDALLVEGLNQTISVDGIQLSSRHNRVAEAQLFIDTLPVNCDHVTLYGIGMGDVPILLLEQQKLTQLNVCLFNTALFALLISYTDQTQWLSHNAVQLQDAASLTSLDTIYLTSTADLTLSSDGCAHLRDLLVFEQNRHYANQKHSVDDPKFLARIADNMPFVLQEADAAELHFAGRPNSALVIGTGPTLEQHYDYLKKQRQRPTAERPVMIAVDTAFKALMSQGIVPDIVVTIEYFITPAHFPAVIPSSVTLVYFPCVHADVISPWAGPRFMAYSKSQKYDELAATHPKLRLFTNGSVIHPTVDLAVNLGAQDITLFGCDFSYPNNKTHAFWQDGTLGISTSPTKRHWVLNGHGERVATDLSFRGYLKSLEHYIATQTAVTFYRASQEGAHIRGTEYRECTR